MNGLPLVLFALNVAAGAPTFESSVRPILSQTCAMCHNEKLASGGFNVAGFLESTSLATKREGWDRILAKVRTGEMPPKGVPHPPVEQMDALVKYVESEFDRADKLVKPDPGRVIAHRLNRTEYANTIRDLLGVTYHAEEEFPIDDSSYGFDNIGAVLTVSPTLMQKYMQAAEQIASRAVGGDPLPKPGLFNKRNRIRRPETGTIEFKDRFEFDADYIVRALLVGHRGDQDKPVTLVISVDGKPIRTETVSTKITAVNKQGGATNRVNVEQRAFIAQGDHVIRAAFVGDDGLKDIPVGARLNNSRNMYPDTIEIAGPFPAEGPHTSQNRLLTCEPSCVLTALAHKAYRRPVKREEVAELMKVYSRARAGGYTEKQSLQFAMETMLVSPQFLFRIEKDPKEGTTARISDVELASRLSYFLWSSMPDDELLRIAEANQLHRPAVLDAQLARMIADPKSAAFAENFSGQWLEIRGLDASQPDAKKYPEWDPELREAMRTETSIFFSEILRKNRPISDFIDAKYTFLNESLAKYYGVEGVTGTEFRKVELNGEQRSGVLTQASVLTVTSYPNRTSVVLRGKYLLENILGAPPPPPPPDVPKLDEGTVGVAKSLRQQMEQHRADPVCASCHSKMDVLGFGLENYDAIGRWRTADGKFPVDSSGAFPNGKSFNGPAQMKALLHDNMPEFARCLTEKLLTYSLGRGIEAYDRRTVQDLVRHAAAGDYKFQTLITAIVHSAPFQQRRAEATNESSKQEMASR